MSAANLRQLVVDDLGEHAAERAANALRDVAVLGETPKECATVAVIGLCGVLGAAAGFIGDALKAQNPDAEIDAEFAVRETLRQLTKLTIANAEELRSYTK